ADYASANAFLDHFAVRRNRLAAAGLRCGHTLSIAWPLWEEGGMHVDPAVLDSLKQSLGMHPLATDAGVEIFHRGLALGPGNLLVAFGDLPLLRRKLLAREPAVQPSATPVTVSSEIPTASPANGGGLEEQTREFLKRQLSDLLKIPAHRIDVKAPFEAYGINSILAMGLTSRLEKTFGTLSKTLFFEYQSLHDLTAYFLQSHRDRLIAQFAPAPIGLPAQAPSPTAPTAQAGVEPATARRLVRRRRSSALTPARTEAEPIAIVGLSGRYPEAADLHQFWRNLRDGKDCIVEVPADRWDWRAYFSEDRDSEGNHFSRHGGFIKGVDEFDPLFFGIPPVEAETMDPQERLFLQHAWMAVEDAGYSRASLRIPHPSGLAGQVGVYVGVMYGEYQLLGAEASLGGRRMGFASNLSHIANRVSYVLNLHGPSLAVDTMCSSSLTAIHLACQDLKSGRTSLAIAGGVNVSIHPNKYLMLSAGQFISSDGHCQSFGEGGDGYIPGEGVGVVVLKRLSEALRDGDNIHGIIRGTALNHGGKTNGYTVPNPQAQASVIAQALAEARVHPRQISYLEAHGTGTKLGDPIEIAALTQAFRRGMGGGEDNGFCLIGSAKSNIGHCESAAGIAGLTKVLLQMRHGQIAPSLHSSRLNPHIDFAKTPFEVNQALRPWERPVVEGRVAPRLAGISSFGAGGSNAHLIVEEYVPERPAPAAGAGKRIVPLSARTAEQLQRKAGDLLEHLREASASGPVDLDAVAYTLQTGREAMEERLGILAGSAEELMERLRSYRDGAGDIEDTWQGQVKRGADGLALLNHDEDMQEAIGKWVARKKLGKLLELWVKGLDLEWEKLHGETKPRRVSLPTYPFAKERYWINTHAAGSAPHGAAERLHPLVHRNTSDFGGPSYASSFTGRETFLMDHRIKTGTGFRKILPAAAYLEMIRAAVTLAASEGGDRVLELRSLAWLSPLEVDAPTDVVLDLACDGEASEGAPIDFEIHSARGEAETVHCRGVAILSASQPPPPLDLAALEAATAKASHESSRLYSRFSAMGLEYGPGHRTLTRLRVGDRQLLATLRLPASQASGAKTYSLHPSLLDGALQACIGLLADLDGEPGRPALPFALESMRIFAPCIGDLSAWCRYSPGNTAGDATIRLDIDLCDSDGKVSAELRGFTFRPLGASTSLAGTATLLAVPEWEAAAPSAPSSTAGFSQRHVIVIGLPPDAVEKLAEAMPGTTIIRPEGGETLPDRYTAAAEACFECVRAILRDKPREKALIQVVVAGEDEACAGLSALLATASRENPMLAGRTLIVPAEMPGEEVAARLREESGQAEDALVRYEGGTRQVLRWRETAPGSAAPRIAFQERGVYLITGGLGGLGLVFAREILKRTQNALVILAGRSASSAKITATLAALPGSDRVVYRQADVVDPEQARQLVSSILAEHGRLNGIIHGAGMIRDNFILRKDAEEFRRVLAPKVAGAAALDEASRDAQLDFLVFFSSTA
ncbi:MAG TPA: SDR family NAD(P)-dependent oxidoreductase, partial [Fibrobacteria bacterium]|nr:SDR family NAD(P)-dependent oxidoreductase [Fibrobacteria bacterium]